MCYFNSILNRMFSLNKLVFDVYCVPQLQFILLYGTGIDIKNTNIVHITCKIIVRIIYYLNCVGHSITLMTCVQVSSPKRIRGG